MKLWIDNVWSPYNGEFSHLFDESFIFVKNSSESDIILQSNWNTHISNEKKKIFVCMEPYNQNNYNFYNIALITHKENKGDNVIYYPFGIMFMYFRGFDKYILNKQPSINSSKKFCLMITSNPKPHRINFCKKLMEYKQIDCYGNVLRNKEAFKHMYWTDEFLNLVKQYKFMICFENSDIEGYFTEKIINAYMGETIPIYWCSKNNYDIINKKCLVNVEDFTDEKINHAIHEIIKLDTDNSIYNEKIKEPFFIDNKIPQNFELENIRRIINEKIKPQFTSKLIGGLGNQLFNVASIWGLAEKYGANFVLTDSSKTDGCFRHDKNFYYELYDRFLTKENISWETSYTPKNKYTEALKYTDNGTYQLKNTIFDGYFQSPKYFENIKDKIIDWILPQNISFDNLEKVCIVHIRMGDYFEFKHLLLDLKEYYLKCISKLPKDTKIVISTNDREQAIKYYPEVVKFVNNDFLLENDPLKIIRIMASCGRGVIASNSSFSWWGAYLGYFKNKTQVFLPRPWFSDSTWFYEDIYFEGANVIDIK